SRAKWATQRTCSAVNDTAKSPDSGTSQVRHLERLALDRPLHLAGADAGDADALAGHVAPIDNLDALQVRGKGALGDAGGLAADAAQVLRLAAAGDLVADRRFLAADGTFLAHVSRPLSGRRWIFCRKRKYSGQGWADKRETLFPFRRDRRERSRERSLRSRR